jgi:hypothetical protein
MGSVCMALIDKRIFVRVSDTMIAFCLNKIYEGRYRRSTYGYLIFNPHSGPYFRINQMSPNNLKPIGTKVMPSIRNHLPVNFLK